MPGRREHGDGAEPSSYVLVLSKHEDAGRGYSLELAPLPGGGASPRAHRGRGWTTEAATAADAGTASRAHAGSPREAATAAGAGTSSRAHAHGSSRAREAATGTGSRARGRSPTRKAAAARLPRARDRGRGTAVEVGPSAHGGRTATDGGAASSGRGDAAGGKDHGEYDPLAAAREAILQDMREMIFSRATPEEQFEISDAESKNGDDIKSIREDDIWNKRQLIYGIALLGPLGFVPAIVAIMPQWMLFTFAVVWGLASFGFPVGLYGNSRIEMGYSRHMARLVFMGFSLLVIYTLYQYMALVGSSSPSAPPPVPDMLPPHADMIWTIGFGILGVIVMAGHILSWVRGCMTGSDSDRDEYESSRDENQRTASLQAFGRY